MPFDSVYKIVNSQYKLLPIQCGYENIDLSILFFFILTGQMQISGQESNGMSKQQECSGCKSNIADRFLLKALDQYWHEDCLKCSLCDCRLGEVGSTLFAKANLLLCRNDYLR